VADGFDIADHVAKSLGSHAFRFTAGLVLKGVNRRVDVGSGVFVEIGGRHFIATAAHNIAGLPDERIGLVHDERVHGEYGGFISRFPDADTSSYTLDLGYLELGQKLAAGCGKEFLPLSRLRPRCGHVDSSGAYLLGYPAGTSGLESRPQCIALGAVGTATVTREPGSVRNTEPDVDIVLTYAGDHFNTESQNIMEPVPPDGLSGGGIWAIPGVEKSKIWSAEDAVLIGIQNRQRRRSGILLGTQIQHWLALVASRNPELDDLIEDVLQSK
jgi:hypothetical protein